MNAHRKHKRPHPITHRRRGISRKFAQFRTAGKGALVAFLAVLGPGLLAGLYDDDPAGIATYSMLGADHGYRLLWIIPVSTVLLVYFHLVAVHIGGINSTRREYSERSQLRKSIFTSKSFTVQVL